VLLALLAWAFAATPAQGAYAGKNGRIATVYDQFDRGGGFIVALRLLDTKGATKARYSRCSRADESEEAQTPCPYDPAFSPDGRTIAHTLGKRLALQPVAGGPPVLLPALTERDRDPYPSPDGKELVFTGTVSKKPNLFSVKFDGSGLAQLTRAGGGSAAWSSRGEIAYMAGGKIWRMRPGGKRAYVAKGGRPDWSPSGLTIAYVSRGSIYRVPARGAARRRLVRGRALSVGFSPDGRSIALARLNLGDIGGPLLTARSADGAGVRRVAGGGELPVGSTWLRWGAPAWQPVR
jgi:Tol biopolymer transport system component